jgi:hypothetical protein
VVSDSTTDTAVESAPKPNASTVSPDVVIAEAARLDSLPERPTALAHLAGQLRATFGPGASAIWRGPENCKAFLIKAVPAIDIVLKGPSHIISPGLPTDERWPAILRE